MKITGVTLYRFRNIKGSGITKLQAVFTQKVQIIVGTNGGGKTSVLNQLSPFSSTRSMYDHKGEKGYKELILENNGVEYKLQSDYEKPSSPHLFFQGDNPDNLNVGRTTNTQEELVAEYLGITPLVDDLIMNRYQFPKWTNGKRRELLMDVNPDDIRFMLDLAKAETSKIKACKNNLTRLQSRKILLETDLLDEQQIAELTSEKEDIDKRLAEFQQNLMNIEIGMRAVASAPVLSSTLNDLSPLTKEIKRNHHLLYRLSHINRDDHLRQRDRESALSTLAVYRQQTEQADQDITQWSDQLADLEVRYKDIALEGELGEIDQTVKRLERDREKLLVPRPPFELTREELTQKLAEIEIIRDKLHLFTNLTVRLLPAKRRQHRHRMLISCQGKQSSYKMRLGDLYTQLESLSRQHSVEPKDIPDSPCAKNACPLYTHFMEDYQHTEERRQKIRSAIAKGERKTNRLDGYVAALDSYFTNAKPFTDAIQWISNHAQTNPVFHHVLRQMDILSTLSTNPNRIIHQLQEAYQNIENWLKLKDISADLETAYALKQRQISSESHDTVRLVAAIEKIKGDINNKRIYLATLLRQTREREKHLHDINQFTQIKETVFRLRNNHLHSLQGAAQAHERDKLRFLKKTVEELRASCFLRLSDIERILRSQSSLKERYQEEVLSQIAVIEKEMADRQQMEMALLAIPKKYMIRFINKLFTQANKLIAMVWTVPLQIELLKPDDPLTYDFTILGDHQSRREMSECSEGQTEIISLAINLSLRIILGYMNYPICLDEVGRTMDERHKQNLAVLLKRLLDDNVMSQMFLVSHTAILHEGFNQSETMVIREDNIVLPERYNEHVTIS